MTRYPENTLLALENALHIGADAIEFDLQLNKDNDFVVIHDDTFWRTANVKRSVLNTHTRDIEAISVHQPARFNQAFYPQPVPLLEDVLKILARYPHARAFIEIKEESLKYWGVKRVMQQLIKSISCSAYARMHQCIVISFSAEAVAYTRENTELATGWVVKKYDRKNEKKARHLQPDFLICNERKLLRNGSLWQGNWQWMVYDIKRLELALAYARRGICYIETGDIEAMLNQQRSINSTQRSTE